MNCPYCGGSVAEGAAFCGNCGAKMDAQPAPATETPFASEPATPPPADFASTVGPTEGPVFTPPALAVPPKRSNRNKILIIIVVAVLLCCCCFILISVLGPMLLALGTPTGTIYTYLTPSPIRIR